MAFNDLTFRDVTFPYRFYYKSGEAYHKKTPGKQHFLLPGAGFIQGHLTQKD
jgi:hypothetical protein